MLLLCMTKINQNTPSPNKKREKETWKIHKQRMSSGIRVEDPATPGRPVVPPRGGPHHIRNDLSAEASSPTGPVVVKVEIAKPRKKTSPLLDSPLLREAAAQGAYALQQQQQYALQQSQQPAYAHSQPPPAYQPAQPSPPCQPSQPPPLVERSPSS